jgi:hypothetical protein
MPFRIELHEPEGILEVIYPVTPTLQDVEDYARNVRARIDAMAGRRWVCLVDQRDVGALSPEIVEVVADLNAYAEQHGMRRAARVVSSAVARLQSTRLVREAMLRTEFRVFESRDEAMAWLRAPRPTSTIPPRSR